MDIDALGNETWASLCVVGWLKKNSPDELAISLGKSIFGLKKSLIDYGKWIEKMSKQLKRKVNSNEICLMK